MVQGIESRRRRYVCVTSLTDEEGATVPLSITWEDGRVFTIDRVLDARHARSLKVGGNGMRYLVRIGNAETYLYFEGPRWFVEEKVRGM